MIEDVTGISTGGERGFLPAVTCDGLVWQPLQMSPGSSIPKNWVRITSGIRQGNGTIAPPTDIAGIFNAQKLCVSGVINLKDRCD
jgi:hypothetical protein